MILRSYLIFAALFRRLSRRGLEEENRQQHNKGKDGSYEGSELWVTEC